VRRRPGSGTFVQAPAGPRPVVADLPNLLSGLMVGEGLAVDQAYPHRALHPLAGLQQQRLGDGGGRRDVFERVRLIDGQPFSYLTTHVPERVGLSYSEADLAATPLRPARGRGW
jgi:GntR family transcriptional regulator